MTKNIFEDYVPTFAAVFTDTHTHLYLPEFDSDREAVIRAAMEKNILRFFLPNIDSSSIAGMLELVKNYPDRMFPMIGLHPCSVNNNTEKELNLVESYLKSGPGAGMNWAAIGEIGIDLYWDKTFVPQQEAAFRKQIDWAVEYRLPVVIHSRNSLSEIYDILVDIRNKKPFTSKYIRGIFHCFSGTLGQAEKIIEYGGFKFGIGGVVTFKNSGLDKLLEQISPEHIVLETDAPYLAPVPFRGKRNEPAMLITIAEKISEIKKIPLEEVGKITTANAREVFGF